MNRIFYITTTQRLIIVAHAIEQMNNYVQRWRWQKEAGGVLLGRHLLDSNDVVVDDVTCPQITDRRSRFSFYRSKKHEQLSRNRWEEQGKTAAYLGLWHTHPEKDPTPSQIDRQDWERAISQDIYEGERLFFPIVGIQRIRVWSLDRQGKYLEIAEDES